MTTQDKIGQLAFIASLDPTAIPSTVPKQAMSVAPRASIRVSPWGTPAATREHLSPVPFGRSHDIRAQDLRVLFADGRGRGNRKRSHSQPPLGLALVCLVTSTSALLVSSTGAEAEIAAKVPEIRQFASDYESVMVDVVARERGLKDLSMNVPPGN